MDLLHNLNPSPEVDELLEVSGGGMYEKRTAYGADGGSVSTVSKTDTPAIAAPIKVTSTAPTKTSGTLKKRDALKVPVTEVVKEIIVRPTVVIEEPIMQSVPVYGRRPGGGAKKARKKKEEEKKVPMPKKSNMGLWVIGLLVILGIGYLIKK